jgi:hypothetical protein
LTDQFEGRFEVQEDAGPDSSAGTRVHRLIQTDDAREDGDGPACRIDDPVSADTEVRRVFTLPGTVTAAGDGGRIRTSIGGDTVSPSFRSRTSRFTVSMKLAPMN